MFIKQIILFFFYSRTYSEDSPTETNKTKFILGKPDELKMTRKTLNVSLFGVKKELLLHEWICSRMTTEGVWLYLRSAGNHLCT